MSDDDYDAQHECSTLDNHVLEHNDNDDDDSDGNNDVDECNNDGLDNKTSSVTTNQK